MPTTTLDLRPWHQQDTRIRVEIDPATIFGAHGFLGSHLVFEVQWSTNDSTGYTELLVLEGHINWTSESVLQEGFHIPAQTIGPNANRLWVPVRVDQIEAVEERRAGSAVDFMIRLSGIAVLPNPGVAILSRVLDADGTVKEESRPQLETKRVDSTNPNYLHIEREHWLRILDALGAGSRRLVELPLPSLPSTDLRWGTCMQHLDSATQQFRLGEYERVLAECRKAAEGIATVLAEIWHVPRRYEKPFHSWTKEISGRLTNAWENEKASPEMLASLLSSIWSWTSPSAHYGTSISTREHASFSLSLCTDLIMFAGQLVGAHPPVPPKDSDENHNENLLPEGS